MTLIELVPIVSALALFLSFGTAVWTVFSGPSRKNADRITAMGVRLDDYSQRLSAVEQVQRSLPKTSDMHELELAMTRLQGEIKTMSAVMSGQSQIMERLEAIVGRHENHLLDGSGRNK
jgi:TolA-binding protein